MSTSTESSRSPRRTPPHVAEYWIDAAATHEDHDAPKDWTRTLYAVAEVMFADADGPPEDRRLRWLCRRTRELADEVGGKGILAFRGGLFALNWVGPLLAGKLPPLSRLSFDARVEAMEAFERSPFGMALLAIKAFTSMSYFEHPDVADEVGFDGRCRSKAGSDA